MQCMRGKLMINSLFDEILGICFQQNCKTQLAEVTTYKALTLQKLSTWVKNKNDMQKKNSWNLGPGPGAWCVENKKRGENGDTNNFIKT